MAHVQIINNETNEAVESFDVTGQTNRQIGRLIRGIEINLDHERFHVDRTPEEVYALRVFTEEGVFDYLEVIRGTLEVTKAGRLSFMLERSYPDDPDLVIHEPDTWSHWEPLKDEED